MGAPLPEPQVEDSPLLERIDEFVAALETQGLRIDIEQRLRLNELLLRLIGERALPEDPDAVCRLVTPILAGSPAQQQMCEATFRRVFGGEQETSLLGPNHPPSAPADEGLQQDWGRQPWVPRILMAGALVLALATVTYLASYHGRWGPGVAVTKAPIATPPPSVQVPDVETWIANYPIEELEPPPQRPWNRTWRWYYTEYSPAKWAAVVVPALLYMVFLAFLYWQLLAYLRREAMQQYLRSLDWRLGGVNARFGDRQLVSRLQPLRSLARTHLHRLDMERTVRASAESAGLLRPQYREVPVPTDFVALIDRRSPRDHLAAYSMEVVRSLRNAGLQIEILEFDLDPSVCRFGRTSEFIRLDAVVRRFPDSILLIFACGEQFLDPVHGRPWPAVYALRDARRAMLLTPESDGALTPLERRLAGVLGIETLRTSPADVGRLAAMLHTEAGAKPAQPPRLQSLPCPAPMIAFFMERPGRWMQTVAPRAADRRALQEHLRSALPPRVQRWLAATAVFPDLRWPMTLSVKSASGAPHSNRPKLDGDLLAVAQLPWFRGGWMPDWVRSLLQQTLSKAARKSVRQLILDVLGLTERRVSDRIQISLADLHEQRAERIRTDHLTLDYLLPGLRSSYRQFSLPRSWVRQLLRKPLQRLAAGAVAGIFVGAGLSFGALSLIPIDECDLLASSDADNQRIGVGRHYAAVQIFFRDRTIAACKAAINRDKTNGRYWYQLSRVYRDDKEEWTLGLEAAKESAALDYPAGYLSVGYAYRNRPKELGDPDLDEAGKNYDKALKLGNYYAHHGLAMIAAAKGDSRREIDHYTKYYDAGGSALYNLAILYRDGREGIVAPNHAKYIELLYDGIERKGDTGNSLGIAFEREDGVPRDQHLAAKYMEMDVRLTGNAIAAANLAHRYRSGWGVDQDLDRATHLAIYAAKSRSARGLVLLFDLIDAKEAKFKKGHEPPETFDAVRLLYGPASAGDATSQYRLAGILEKGGSHALAEAISWYQKAAGKGHSAAKEALQRLGVSEKE